VYIYILVIAKNIAKTSVVLFRFRFRIVFQNRQILIDAQLDCYYWKLYKFTKEVDTKNCFDRTWPFSLMRI